MLPEPVLFELSADALHRRALAAFRRGNFARLDFIRTLRSLAESRRFFALGFPSIVAYTTRFFGYRKTETYEALRVAAALDRLPALSHAFVSGSISWSALRQITRVAIPATESAWLDFSDGRSVEEVRAEVELAVDEGRDRPRDRLFGLPDLKVRVVLELTRSEEGVLRAALDRICGEVQAVRGGSIAVKDALLYLAERVLATAPGEPFTAGSGSAEPARTILYQVCPECRRAGIETADGRVEISAAAIERVEGSARREEIAIETESARADLSSTGSGRSEVVPESARADSDLVSPEPPVADSSPAIDRPSPPSLRRRVLLRDGRRCSNPSCSWPAEQCHHIVWRSRGGRTALSNEVSVCGRCHALIHAGLLAVEGDPSLGLRWRARAER